MGQAPLLKYWSPMSVGSWAMLLFGLSSFLALLGSLWPEGLLAGLFRRSFLGKGLAVLGTVVGFFAASYTGALLTATNQPLWSDSVWIAPLFLTSAASTGIATLMLLSRVRAPEDTVTLERLGKADRWALGLEAIVVVVLLVSLGPFLAFVLRTWQGWLFLAGTVLLGLLAPLVIHLRVGIIKRRGAVAASVCALAGGFLLRYGVLAVPPELLARGPSPGVPTPSGPSVWVSGFGPEDGRPPGAAGADAGNRPRALQPRSKVFDEEAP
jgi:formate-dependent nitrite reductase membrane component NrfD